jgi:hypothetical protein
MRIGLEGPMRQTTPGPLLKDLLAKIASVLGPLPHARLNIEQQPMTTHGSMAIDLPKKQATRYRKAECSEEKCEFTVRVAASHVRNIGPPHCPRHGEMKVDLPADDGDDENGQEEEHELVAAA